MQDLEKVYNETIEEAEKEVNRQKELKEYAIKNAKKY